MKNHTKSNYFERIINKASYVSIIISISFLLISFYKPDINNSLVSNNIGDSERKLASGTDILFQGSENGLNITDYGNLYKYDQNIYVGELQDANLTYYLDDIHNWKASQVNLSITDIYDTRNWVNNSEFQAPTIYRVYQEYQTAHNYSKNHNPASIVHTIVETHNPTYMRVHFTQIGFEKYYDYLYVFDSDDNYHLITDTDSRYNVYSPWIPGDTIKLTYESDGFDEYYGYHIDYYEYVNDSSNYDINSDTWGFNYVENGVSGTNVYGAGECGNATAMYVGVYGQFVYTYQFDYTKGAFSELYQNLTVPRGQVKNAYISFDYNVPFGLESNDNYIYFKINGKKVYSKGMGDIIEAGKNVWHNTGKIYMDLWTNNTPIFDDLLNEQNFNISVGIMSGSSVELTYFEEAFQNIIWFDNVSLVVTASANSTQNDIDLKVNGINLNDNDWGIASKNLVGNWDSNPIMINFTTKSPDLSFLLDTMINGYHETQSKLGQTTENGITYTIQENGVISWQFSHNFFMPAQYSDFHFIINKPQNWNFTSVLDPTLQSRSYEYGNIGDTNLIINKENAIFPGWWTFEATSPNYLNLSNTKLLKDGEWSNKNFTTDEMTQLKTQVNYSSEIPLNLATTQVNLSIYDPVGNLWYTELKTPLANGTVFFSELYFDALNTSGGTYKYTLFWSNGTSLGGIKSNFILYHLSALRILKPDDAKIDFRTDGFVGDIIPIRVFLYDFENNNTISNSIISHNWTLGSNKNFTESALGIYETILDTADLASKGLYEIVISSSKIGFIDTNITLEINLGEDTKLQRLESEYNIELHANSSIKFKFMDFDNDGIDGAVVNVSIANPAYYTILNTGGGIYDIEFSTLYIINVGVHELNFTFSATGYEPQYYTYQFQIIEQSVLLSVYINELEIDENHLIEFTYYDHINISTGAKAHIDMNNITGGNFTLISGAFQCYINETFDCWYNSSIECLPEYFTFGINYVYLRFEHPNYRTQTFGFQLLVNQVEFNIDVLGYENTVRVDIGGTLEFDVQLMDPKTAQLIENATVVYIWEYGVGGLNEIGAGIYKLTLNLPENLQGSYSFKLIVSMDGNIYKTTELSLLLVIGEPTFPTWILWLILVGSAAIITTLGILSLRSYVIIPRRRKRESKLLLRTQRFKDIQNVQAIVIMHRYSGIPLFVKSYSILEKQKKELFSGFVQAITTIGEEIVGKKEISEEVISVDESDKTRTILELDFKYFYCLICDRQELRIVLVLKEKASDRLKKQISDLSLGLMLQIGQHIEKWDGSIDQFENLMPPIISKYIELSLKDAFVLNSPAFIADAKKEEDFNTMEKRVLNVIYSMAKSKSEFYLEHIVNMVHEDNKNLVIDAVESLVLKKIIIPSNK